MNKWNTLADEKAIKQAIQSLTESGIEVIVVENGTQAKNKILEMLPEGAEVMTNSSVTLDTIGVTEAVNQSGQYEAVRQKLMSMNRATQADQMQKLGAAPVWAIGSVHALTQDGKVIIASNSGSQLGAYAYGSQHVIWVVGTQKIVKDLDEAMKRLYEYTLPLESERAKKAYGVPGSNVSKILIVNKEVQPGRVTIILVKEILGF